MIDNHAASQRQKIVSYLTQLGSANTIQLRHELDILMPAARIHELRHRNGLNIVTIWDEGVNPNGTKHRVARYLLLPGKFQGVSDAAE